MTSLGYVALINWFIFMFKARVEEYYSTTGLICAVSFQFVYNFINLFILIVFILSWMETLTMICKERQPTGKILQHSLKCRDYYIQSRTLNFATFVGANLFIAPAEVAKFNVRHCMRLLKNASQDFFY